MFGSRNFGPYTRACHPRIVCTATLRVRASAKRRWATGTPDVLMCATGVFGRATCATPARRTGLLMPVAPPFPPTCGSAKLDLWSNDKGQYPQLDVRAPDPTPLLASQLPSCAVDAHAHVPPGGAVAVNRRARVHGLVSTPENAHPGLDVQSTTNPEERARPREEAASTCAVPAYDSWLKRTFHARRPHRLGGRAQPVWVCQGRPRQLQRSVWAVPTHRRLHRCGEDADLRDGRSTDCVLQ